MIIYVAQSNTLACVERTSAPDDEPEWTEVPLAGVSTVSVAAKSRIAGTNSADGAQIFFQHPDSSIKSILYDDETKKWEEGDAVPAAAAAGTPLYVMELEDALGVFYLSSERKICGQLQNYETGEWKGNGALAHPSLHGADGRSLEQLIPDSFFEDGVTSFILIWDGEQKAINAYVLAAAALVHIDGGGGRKVLGKWESGAFVPDTAAECGLLINIFIGIFSFCGGGRGYHHYRRHRHRRRIGC